jgi:hypothetical protein
MSALVGLRRVASSSTARGAFALGLALLGLFTAPRAAHAFECSPLTGKDAANYTQVWQSRCIPFYVSTTGSLKFKQQGDGWVPTETVECSSCFLKNNALIVTQSFNRWAAGENRCTDMTFVSKGLTTEAGGFDPDTPYDQKNVVAILEDRESWDKLIAVPSLLAITNVTYAVNTGEILDADILVNGAYFAIEDVGDVFACRNGNRAFDIRNTLVHEIGHLLGFDHTPVADATMFASADACEVKKRDLEQDDKDGLCTVYPTGAAARPCRAAPSYAASRAFDPTPWRNQCTRVPPVVEPGGCSCGAAAPTDALGGIALSGALLRARRRRRSR